MKRTPKYNLPIVEGTDEFYKEDINTAFSTIEGELSDNAEKMNEIELAFAEAQVVNTNIEVTNARKGKGTLREKIDEIDTTLVSNKASIDGNSKKMQNDFNCTFGIVTFIDDDSPNTFWTRWKPILDETQIKIGVAVNTDFVGNASNMSLEQLKTLRADGHDILSHGFTHPDINAMSVADIDNEWYKSRQFLIDNGLGGDLALVYPTGLFSITDPLKVIQVKNTTRKYFRYGIDANSGSKAFPNVLPVDSYEVNRMFIDPKTVTLNDIKSYIDDAYANRKWLIFLTHCGLSWDDSTSANNIKEIINYIKSISLPIMSFSSAESIIGNAIAQGDTRTSNFHFVCKNGATLESNILSTVKTVMTVSSMDCNISEYKQGIETVMQIPQDKDTNFSTGGVMKTYRGDAFYSYQLFYPAQSNDVYRRYWLENTSTWSKFENLNMEYTSKITIMDEPITSYTVHKWTDVQIGNDKDTLVNRGGVMRVYRGEPFYSVALYFPAMSSSFYRRYWNEPSQQWSAWDEFGKQADLTAINNIVNDTEFAYQMDLNTLVEKRNYKTLNSSFVNALINKPNVSNGEAYMEVLPTGTNYIIQKFYYTNGLNVSVYIRNKSGSTWSAWKTVSTM